MIKKKTVSFRIDPYIQEAIVQIVLDILVLIVMSMVLTFADFSIFVSIVADISYFAIALLLHYRVAIQALIDKKKEDYVTETVKIDKFTNEYSFIGDSTGNSYVRFFYPKEMHVGKHRIKIINDKGEKKKLRSVMSFRRIIDFIILKRDFEYLQVTYLKRSKILLRVDLPDNTKLSGKRKKQIEKALHFINSRI